MKIKNLITWLALLLPFIASAQVNTTLQKTTLTETIRSYNAGAAGIDSLALLRNGSLGLFLQAPVGLAATGSTTGGTLAAGTYFYKVTGIDFYGQTKGSSEASATTTGTTSSVALTWTALTGATSYRVYRGTTSGVQNVYYTSTANSYTDINAASTAGTVPLVTTAYIVRLNTDGSVRGQSFVKSGGLSTQFLKADGSIDASTYLTYAVTSVTGTANQITVTGTTTPVISLPATITGLTSITSTGFTGALTGHASLDLALTGGTLSGALTVTDGTQGLIVRPYTGFSGFGAIYSSSIIPGATNYAFIASSTSTGLNAATTTSLNVAGTTILSATATALTISQPLTGTSATFIPTSTNAFLIGNGSSVDANSLTLQSANANYQLRFKNAAGTSLGGIYSTGTGIIVDPSTVTFRGVVILEALIRLRGYTVATLPAGTQGDTAFVTDNVALGLSPTGTNAVGGGSTVVTVFYDGTNWVIN